MRRKANRFLAGLCVALMLTQSVGETALTALAAESSAGVVTEDLTETEDTVSGGNPVITISDGNEETTVSDGNGSGDVSDGDTEKETPAPVMANDGTPQVDEDGRVTVNGEFWGTMDENGMFTVSSDIGVVTSYCFKGWDAVTGICFEEGAYIKSIGSYGFQNCVNLKTVDLSNCPSLTQIGDYAFSGCSALEKVTFNDNLQYINKNAFEKCTSLTDITLVKGLISIRENAFSGCSALSHVRLETMNVVCKTASGGAATGIFANCNIKSVDFAYKDTEEDSENKNIIIPANFFNRATFAKDAEFVIPYKIQEIGEGAFQNSTIAQVRFENSELTPSALSTIGKNAFNGCKNLENVTFPETLQTIGESAFNGCTAFSEINIPNSVNDLGKSAFMGCKGVTSLQLSNATTSIGDNAFNGCTSLEELEIPEGITFTGKGEFSGCTSLKNVTIASTVETIGDETFKGCLSIQKMELPDSVTVIGKSAFENCLDLVTVKYSPNLKEIGDSAFKKCTYFSSNVFPITLEKIGASAFEECQSFRSTVIPINVTTIGSKAFYHCYGIETLTIDSLQLTNCGTAIFDECLIREVVFPEGIKIIPVNLFSQAGFTTDCVITIPNTVEEIGNNAFGGSNSAEVNITSIVFEDGINLTRIGNSAFKYCTAMTQFTIPETVDEIGANAFEGCNKITSIVIPESVTKIGASAFSGCSVLSDITYNAINVTTSNQNIFAKCNIKRILIGNKVSSFPAYLFKGAQFSTNTETGEIEMITLTVPASVEKIGQYALPNIANLQGIRFEDGSALQTIEQYAFYQCINLTDISLPDTVTTIGNYAFSGCTKLGADEEKPFVLPDSLVTLGSGAFSNCPGLTEITIPAGVSKIMDKTFQNDTGLTSVTWDVNLLTEIGASAFEGCSSLTEMNIPSGTTKIGAAAFKNCTGLTKIVIPASVNSIASDAFNGCDNALFFVVPGSYAEKWLQDKGIITKNLLTITYELNGGVNSASNPAGYEAGETFTFAPATRNGYIFKGWYLDEEFETPIEGVEGCNEDLTVYAKWEIEIYTITYVLNGGTNHKDNPATYTFLDKVTFKNPEKEGYTFEGWYSDPEFKKTITNIQAKSFGNKTVYAKWSGGVTLAPTANVESGSAVKAGTKIFLTSGTPGASIYYTIDGSEPTDSSKQYVDGVVIDKALTVKAFAVKKGCDASEVVTFRYELVNEAEDWGDILEEDRNRFKTGDEVPQGIWVAGVEDTVYTGQKITFNLRVYDGKTLLKEKTDYTVSYANNKDAADKNAEKKAPTVTINAKGNYKGKVAVKFTIKPKNITSKDISAEDIVNNVTGKLQKPVPVVTLGKTKLRNKTDFTYEYLGTSLGGYQTKGTYQIKLTGCKNYTGERIITFTLVEGTSIAKTKITGPKNCDYTGAALTPEFEVKMGKDVLVKGKDYEISYSNNRDAGTATATITGKGNYFGSKSVTFKILPVAALNKAQFVFDKTSVEYTGKAYEIGKGINVSVSINGNRLIKDQDYTCSYLKNTDAGTATIVFTGKGGYAGTVKKTFKIVTADMTGLQMQFLDADGNVKKDASYAFQKGGVKPSVLITYNGISLTAGKDYTVSYKKNTALGTADIVVRGKKNFKGTLNGTFTIVQQDIGELSLSAQDVMYKNAAGVVNGSKPTVLDVDGKKLVEGTDYKVSYVYTYNTRLVNGGALKRANTTVNVKSDVIPVESLITVKVTGTGNYKGTTETTIRVFKNTISTAKITVKPQTYTGSEVQPGVDQMTVMVGKEELKVGDFEIVGYKNNIKKGNAEVTIRGIGNYGGTKTVKFKIAEKTFSLFDWLR